MCLYVGEYGMYTDTRPSAYTFLTVSGGVHDCTSIQRQLIKEYERGSDLKGDFLVSKW